MFPSDSELKDIRADAMELLPGICQIVTFTETSDGAGGITESWTAGPDTRCRLAPLGSSPAGVTADRLDERTSHVITLPARTTVTTDSRIQLEGRMWQVTARRTRTATDTLVVRVEVMEVI